MTNSNPKLRTITPENVFFKPLKADFKELFKALSKGIGHTVVGKWEELGTDAVEALSAIGLSTDPGELAFLLVRRSMTRALFDLVGESASQSLAETKRDEGSLIEQLDFSISSRQISIDRRFLDRPSDLPLLDDVQTLLQQWLEAHGITKPTAKAIVGRLPGYFVYALNQEWRRNAKSYAPLLEAMDTPFTKAGEREWAWAAYSALLQRRVQEGVFDEPFSLRQIFVPLNAYYLEDPARKHQMDEVGRTDRRVRRVVVALQAELEQWLKQANREDTIRVISGGPGSGKSSFARIFAAQIAQNGKPKVLFVPLHLIDASKDLVDEVGRFVRDEGVMLQNPLDPESPEPNLLIIFDGLDELASQGKAAAETARAFLREVERTAEKRNLQILKLRVLISGRELVVQESESELRRARQILNLLPYFVPQSLEHNSERDREEYVDPEKLLADDLRQQWWKTYGALTGKGYKRLPKELSRPELDEITAQPLLNYLVALSFTRDKLDFTKEINLNTIYGDLVAAVHERGYEKYRPYAPIRNMSSGEFSRVLEEIGLAAWHGDGRTTTVSEIEEHCRVSGVGALLSVFQEGAKAGVTRLLAAFFFRQYGQRASGDPTFVFTHKSFGEYLAARRIVRAIEKVIRELQRRAESPDEGWDERDALKHWAQVCGPSPLSRYLHVFLLNEMESRPSSELVRWQSRLAKLFSYMLQHGMPMEQLQLGPFRHALFQARNAEEALLVALNTCARVTEQVSAIEQPDPAAFGAWFKRMQGQRTSGESVLAASCLSFLDLSAICLDISDFYGADFTSAKLAMLVAYFATFAHSNLSNTDLRGATLERANLERANLERANLERAHLPQANLEGVNLEGANLKGANLEGANLRRANLGGANVERANLERVNLKGANLEGAHLEGANLRGANLGGANLEKANFEGANMEGAELKAAKPQDERNQAERGGLPGTHLLRVLRRMRANVHSPVRNFRQRHHAQSPLPGCLTLRGFRSGFTTEPRHREKLKAQRARVVVPLFGEIPSLGKFPPLSKLLTQREGVHRYPQRGCSQRQYRLALLVHPAFKFPERHVS